MAQRIEDKVDFSESYQIKMTYLLNQRGYDAVMETPPASNPNRIPEEVGILKGSKPQSAWFGLIRVKRDFIGRLLPGLENTADGMYHSMSTCIIKVYGRKYVPELKNLATDISAAFNSRVSVQLVAEEPLEETL